MLNLKHANPGAAAHQICRRFSFCTFQLPHVTHMAVLDSMLQTRNYTRNHGCEFHFSTPKTTSPPLLPPTAPSPRITHRARPAPVARALAARSCRHSVCASGAATRRPIGAWPRRRSASMRSSESAKRWARGSVGGKGFQWSFEGQFRNPATP